MIFVTTIWRHSHILFIRSCNFNWIACVTSFFALSGASFFLRVIKFLVTLDLPHTQKWLPHFEIDLFTLIQRDKVKLVCVTLNEGYLRSANRGSNNLYRFLNQNITDQPSMRRRVFLVCLFYCFFRLPIYESIAAIFWQSASYVSFTGHELWRLND